MIGLLVLHELEISSKLGGSVLPDPDLRMVLRTWRVLLDESSERLGMHSNRGNWLSTRCVLLNGEDEPSRNEHRFWFLAKLLMFGFELKSVEDRLEYFSRLGTACGGECKSVEVRMSVLCFYAFLCLFMLFMLLCSAFLCFLCLFETVYHNLFKFRLAAVFVKTDEMLLTAERFKGA